MALAGLALGLWTTTSVMGSYLFTCTADVGRPGSGAEATHLPSLLLFVHPVFAFLGVGVWIAYLSTDEPALAWTGVVVLVGGGLVGGYLGARTELPRHRDEARVVALAAQGAEPYAISATAVAEQRIPRLATATHGLLAALTTLCAVVSAVRTL